jgi:hypothetical protein
MLDGSLVKPEKQMRYLLKRRVRDDWGFERIMCLVCGVLGLVVNLGLGYMLMDKIVHLLSMRPVDFSPFDVVFDIGFALLCSFKITVLGIMVVFTIIGKQNIPSSLFPFLMISYWIVTGVTAIISIVIIVFLFMLPDQHWKDFLLACYLVLLAIFLIEYAFYAVTIWMFKAHAEPNSYASSTRFSWLYPNYGYTYMKLPVTIQ